MKIFERLLQTYCAAGSNSVPQLFSRNNLNETPLILAPLLHAHASFVHEIMSHTPKPSSNSSIEQNLVAWQNNEHFTALDVAAKNGNIDCLRELLAYERQQPTFYKMPTLAKALRCALADEQTQAREWILKSVSPTMLRECERSFNKMWLTNPKVYAVLLQAVQQELNSRAQQQKQLQRHEGGLEKNPSRIQQYVNAYVHVAPPWHSKPDSKQTKRRLKILKRTVSSTPPSDPLLTSGSGSYDFVFVHHDDSDDDDHDYLVPPPALPNGITQLSPMQLEIGQKIGAGSYGIVYEGLLNETERVAVKQLRRSANGTDSSSSSSPTELAQIMYAEALREARIHSQIRHPNIVKFLGIVVGSDSLRVVSLVMQLVENCSDMETLFVAPTLRAALKRRQQQQQQQALLQQKQEHGGRLDSSNLTALSLIAVTPRRRSYYYCEEKENFSSENNNANVIIEHQHSMVSFVDKLEIATQVASAVQYLHQVKGFVHGDIKPSNVLIAERFRKQPTPDGVPMRTVRSYHAYLADFGITRLAPLGDDISVIELPTSGSGERRDSSVNNFSTSPKQQQQQHGALGYQPPEMFLEIQTQQTETSDIWALAITLLEMCVEEPAYGVNASPQTLLWTFTHQEIVPGLLKLGSSGGDGAEAIRPVLESCLVYEQNKRLSAKQIMDALAELRRTFQLHRQQQTAGENSKLQKQQQQQQLGTVNSDNNDDKRA